MAEIIKDYLLPNAVFWACLVASILLLSLGFALPPRGQIDPTVLTAVGEIFAFATLAVVGHAVEKGISAKLTHNDTTIEIGK